jgi:hypothetical protein
MSHNKYRMSEQRYLLALHRYQDYRAKDPHGPVRYYDSTPLWLE